MTRLIEFAVVLLLVRLILTGQPKEPEHVSFHRSDRLH